MVMMKSFFLCSASFMEEDISLMSSLIIVILVTPPPRLVILFASQLALVLRVLPIRSSVPMQMISIEGAILFALLGYDVGVYPVIKKHTRERKRKIFAWGRGSYINGYPFLWTLGRSTFAFFRGQHSFSNCCSIIFGHLEAMIKQSEKNDTADFVYNHMMKRTKSYLLWKLFRIEKKNTFEVKKIQVF